MPLNPYTNNWIAGPTESAYQAGEFSEQDIQNYKSENERQMRAGYIKTAMSNPEKFDTSVMFEQMRGLMHMRDKFPDGSKTIDQKIDYLVREIERRRPGWTIDCDYSYYDDDNTELRIPHDPGLFEESTVQAIYDEDALRAYAQLQAEKEDAIETGEFNEAQREGYDYASEAGIDYDEGFED